MRSSRPLSGILVLTMLSGLLPACAYVIPEDPNMPRNNKVEGEIRRPMLNTNGGAPQSFNRLQSNPYQEPVVEVPPVATSDQSADASALASMRPAAGGEARPVALNPVRTVVTAPQTAAVQSLPPAVITPNPALQENAAYQMSAAGYPSLHEVPARPVTQGDASSQEQLKRARAALEADRVDALENKVRLDADAAAEPSLLHEMPAAPVPAMKPQPIAPQSAVRPPSPAQQAANMAPAAGGNPAAPIGITLASVDMRAASLPASPVFAPPAPLASRSEAQAPVAAAAPVHVQPTAVAPVAAIAPQTMPAAGGVPVRFRTSVPVPVSQPQPIAAVMPAPVAPDTVPAQAAAPAMEPRPVMAAVDYIPEIPPQAQQQPMSGRVAPISNGDTVAETFSPLITKKPAKQPLQLHKVSSTFNPVAPFGTQPSNARTVARYAAPAARPVAAMNPASVRPQTVAALPPAALLPAGGEQPNVTAGDFNPLAPVPMPAGTDGLAAVSAQAAATMAPAAQAPAPASAPAIRRGDFDPMASYNPAVARPAAGYTASSRYSEQR